MADIYNTEKIVKKVLELYPATRKDDFLLIFAVYREIDFNKAYYINFCDLMVNHKNHKFPAFKTITRARRKLQSKYPELKDAETCISRMNEERDYIEYAIDGYNPTFMKFVDSQD